MTIKAIDWFPIRHTHAHPHSPVPTVQTVDAVLVSDEQVLAHPAVLFHVHLGQQRMNGLVLDGLSVQSNQSVPEGFIFRRQNGFEVSEHENVCLCEGR